MPIITEKHPGLSPVANVDLNGKFVILDSKVLNKRFKAARFQLLEVVGGFGAHPESRGRKITTKALDGEIVTGVWYRDDFLGLANDELVAECKADTSEPIQINLKEICYFAINGIKGTSAKKPTIAAALKEVKAKTLVAGIGMFLCHPECQFDGMIFSSPPGTKTFEVKQFTDGKFAVVSDGRFVYVKPDEEAISFDSAVFEEGNKS